MSVGSVHLLIMFGRISENRSAAFHHDNTEDKMAPF